MGTAAIGRSAISRESSRQTKEPGLATERYSPAQAALQSRLSRWKVARFRIRGVVLVSCVKSKPARSVDRAEGD